MPEKTIKQQFARWLDQIPPLHNGKFRREWLRAITKQSRKDAMDANCRDCSCWQNVEVRDCLIITCPLWQYRPLGDVSEKERVGKVAQTILADFQSQNTPEARSGAQKGTLNANVR